MSIKVGINGFGRIGRNIFRAASELNPEIEVVAVNDLGDAHTFAHLLKHDTALGTFGPQVSAGSDTISVDGRSMRFLSERDPGDLSWREMGVDIVIESTGLFTDATTARAHIDAGARKVIITAPAKNEDKAIVLGVNENTYDDGKHQTHSNASCTTNAASPVIAILDQAIGITLDFFL